MPYGPWEGTDLWRVLDRAVEWLERTGRISIADGSRDTVVGELCSMLDVEGILADSRLTRVKKVLTGSGAPCRLGATQPESPWRCAPCWIMAGRKRTSRHIWRPFKHTRWRQTCTGLRVTWRRTPKRCCARIMTSRPRPPVKTEGVPDTPQEALARAALLALTAVGGLPANWLGVYLMLPRLAPLTADAAARYLAGLVKPISCCPVALPNGVGIAYWERDDPDWRQRHVREAGEYVADLRQMYELADHDKVLLRGGARSMLLTLREVAQLHLDYDFLLATRVAARPDELAAARGARVTIDFGPPDTGFQTNWRLPSDGS